MPSYSRKVQIEGKSAQELYDKIDGDIERFLQKSLESVPIKFDLEKFPEKKEIQLKSSMVSAQLVCEEGTIEVSASLSLLATPFKSKIDEGINRWLAKAFGIKI